MVRCEPIGSVVVARFNEAGQVQTDDEFSPSLLILGTVYEVEANTELDARARAAAHFANELSKQKLPLPAGPIHAELVG